MSLDPNNSTRFATETYGLAFERCYNRSTTSDGKFYRVEEENPRWKSVASFFETAFLPHGFPDSVSSDYLQYQLWDSIQAFASSINGSIATHAVLESIGVGDHNTTVLAATITWIIKDGTSMVGRILFAWSRGTQLDSECKKWRLFADILNDIAMFLEIISAFFKQHVQIILCMASLFKSIVGVAGGATRAALTEHQALQNNMADVSAKDGSQETMVNLAALICSLVILPFVTQNHVLMWLMYGVLTFVHLYANYHAVRSVVMETFNAERFRILIEHHLNTNFDQILPVPEVNYRESVFLSPFRKETVSIKLGTSLDDTITNKSYGEFLEYLDVFDKSLYILTISSTETAAISVTLHEEATVATQFEAMFHASIISNLVSSCTHQQSKQSRIRESFETWKRSNTGTRSEELNLVMFSNLLKKEKFEHFLKQLDEHGWDTESALFDVGKWRATWKRPVKTG